MQGIRLRFIISTFTGVYNVRLRNTTTPSLNQKPTGKENRPLIPFISIQFINDLIPCPTFFWAACPRSRYCSSQTGQH